MKTLKRIIKYFFFAIILYSCSEMPDMGMDEAELRRMPFKQRVFLLNSSNQSQIYEIDYDFQGLRGDAMLTKLPISYQGNLFDLPRGGHMSVDPTKSYLVISITRDKALWFVSLTPNVDGLYEAKRLPFEGSIKKITQVDFDQHDFLFLAGSGGFFRVTTPTGSNEIWTMNDGESVTVNHLGFNGSIEFEDEGEDGEDYFDEPSSTDSDYAFISRKQRQIDRGKFKFSGGDITFTQNSGESGGFEQERLVSFTQWGNMAAYIALNIADASMNYNAKALFRVRAVTKENGKGTHKVTGGAMMGDNLLITSHHFTSDFSVWNMAGEELARPSITFADPADAFSRHNWGDMATTQTFDENITIESRFIGADNPYIPYYEGLSLAEVKLYRPGAKVTDQYDLSDDNPGINLEARRNAANADVADLRKNALKFTSLGGGSMLLKFPTVVIPTAQTQLQVVETSWNKSATYDDKTQAYNDYKERASVYISYSNEQYYGSWADDESNWVKVGDAYIMSNSMSLDGFDAFSWVKIVDDTSLTPDGFDVNFVGVYEEAAPLDPFCTNETVIVAQDGVDTQMPIRVTPLGTYVDETVTGYRWRIRNNSADEMTLDWDLFNQGLTGSQIVPAGFEVHFSIDLGGIIIVYANGALLDIVSHSGPSKDISQCN
ncbi:MAG: hypothetical protein ACJASN_002134 [Cyclobacteriaceae bacterium]|jgi:hypothetical protein